MDIRQLKYKKLVIIGFCIICGMIPPYYFFFTRHDLNNNISGYFFVICQILSLPSEFIFNKIGIYHPYWLSTCIYFSLQFIIYATIGLILSFFAEKLNSAFV